MPETIYRPVLSAPRWAPETCASLGCDEPIAYFVSWPGRSRYLCSTHAEPSLPSARECPPLDWGDRENNEEES